MSGVAGRIAAAVLSRPMVYDIVQTAAGQREVAAQLKAALAEVPAGSTLDVGAASGSFANRLGIRPICLDLDPRALRQARRRTGAPAVAADAARLPFPDASFGRTLCVAVSHHLDDPTLHLALSELARVTAGSLVFLDALRNESRWISRWLWRHDRGRHPRTLPVLRAALERRFSIREERAFTVYHQYALWLATPR